MKQGIQVRSHPVVSINTFLLIALFAVMSLLTVLLSVRSYAGIEADVSSDSNTRLLSGYLPAKLRASDVSGGVELRDIGGQTVLCLHQGELTDMIYVADGMLREALVGAEDVFDPALGEPIAPLRQMTLTRDGSLMHITLIPPQGDAVTLVCALRAKEAILP